MTEESWIGHKQFSGNMKNTNKSAFNEELKIRENYIGKWGSNS